jgi:methylglyoxal synthase
MKEVELDNTLSHEGLLLAARAVRRRTHMTIALLASEDCKKALSQFALKHEEYLSQHSLVATSGTCKVIRSLTDLEVKSVGHGPEGGDIILASEVLSRKVDMVIFLRSGMEISPHEEDIKMLLRATNLTNCPLATNISTAEMLVAASKATPTATPR